MRTLTKVIFLLLLHALLSTSAGAETRLTVGVYQNKPIVFVDPAGSAKGIYIDILEDMAVKEGWVLNYHPCTWEACLVALEKGDIDLLTGIAYSEERTLRFDFNSETLVTNWAQIYAARPGSIPSFMSLSGKKLAVVEGDIYYKILLSVGDPLNIHPRFVPVKDYETVLRLVDTRTVHAGVVPRIFGGHNESAYNIFKTPINFSPVELRFAVPKGSQRRILDAIDHHLSAMKQNPNSIYYNALDYWIEGVHKLSFPGWLKPIWVIGGVAGILLVILVGNFFLRWQVRVKTEALRQSIVARERIESDLRIARDIQRDLLPKANPPFPDLREIDLFAVIEPAKAVGGDFYDYFFIDTARLCLFIGDVSDKGVPAALFMARAKTLLKASAMDMSTLGSMLSVVNRELCENNDSYMFVTVFCAIINIHTGELIYCNAGHNPPLISKSGKGSTFLMGTPNSALGIDSNVVFKTDRMLIKSDTSLLLYTDGITEAFNAEGETYSEERLNKAFSSLCTDPAKEQVQSIFASVIAFSGESLQADDIALLSFKYLGSMV